VDARHSVSSQSGQKKLGWTGFLEEKGLISKHGGHLANVNILMRTIKQQLHSGARHVGAVPFSQILPASVAINSMKLMRQHMRLRVSEKPSANQ
jgi:hypothetical protein